MDLISTGKFIKQMRKEVGLTQNELAQKLNISEKTVSKWECGNGFPDTSLMLPLCEVLGISANELLSAKKLEDAEYKVYAEENLIALRDQQEKSTKHLLTLELVVGYMSTITFILVIFMSSFFMTNLAAQICMIVFAFVIFFVGLFFALKIEREAGFYECAHCHHKHIPSYKSFVLAMHMGRTRYLKCPKCGKKSWQKKTIK